MALVLDHLGFPYVAVPAYGLAVGTWPVLKAEFECYLGDPAGPGDEWYAAVLAAGPRASWRRPPPGAADGLFMTAATPDEAAAFARWLGPDYRLPSQAEWRAADKALDAPVPAAALPALAADPRVHPAAAAVARWAAGRRPATWRDATLFAGGLMEWVRLPGGGHGLYGRPAPAVYNAPLLNPQVHDPPRPKSADRHRAFGFRLVRPLHP